VTRCLDEQVALQPVLLGFLDCHPVASRARNVSLRFSRVAPGTPRRRDTHGEVFRTALKKNVKINILYTHFVYTTSSQSRYTTAILARYLPFTVLD
jgi:hypothetical protein